MVGSRKQTKSIEGQPDFGKYCTMFAVPSDLNFPSFSHISISPLANPDCLLPSSATAFFTSGHATMFSFLKQWLWPPSSPQSSSSSSRHLNPLILSDSPSSEQFHLMKVTMGHCIVNNPGGEQFTCDNGKELLTRLLKLNGIDVLIFCLSMTTMLSNYPYFSKPRLWSLWRQPSSNCRPVEWPASCWQKYYTTCSFPSIDPFGSWSFF